MSETAATREAGLVGSGPADDAAFDIIVLNHVLDPKLSLDGASSVFFLGRKVAVPIKAAEIIDYYQGGNRSPDRS